MLRNIRNRLLGRQDLKTLVANGLRLGHDVHIGPDVLIDPSHCWLIEIGDRCTLAPRVHILAHDASTKRHLGFTKIGRVTIGPDTFIGAGTIILPGVTIGANSIIAAGSVVTVDIPDGVVARGNPVHIAGSTDEYVERHRVRAKSRPVYPAAVWTAPAIDDTHKQEMHAALSDGMAYVE